ncbi:MAG: hypothetical protein DIU54_015790, partial [Acidobacteriota bacterium]
MAIDLFRDDDPFGLSSTRSAQPQPPSLAGGGKQSLFEDPFRSTIPSGTPQRVTPTNPPPSNPPRSTIPSGTPQR